MDLKLDVWAVLCAYGPIPRWHLNGRYCSRDRASAFFVTDALYFTIYNSWLLWALCRKGTYITPSQVVTTRATEEHELVLQLQEGGPRWLSPLMKNIPLRWVHANALHIVYGFCWSRMVFPYTKRRGNGWDYLPLNASYRFGSGCAQLDQTRKVWHFRSLQQNISTLF